MNFTARLLAGGLAGGAAVAICSCGSSAPSEPSATALTSSVRQAVQNAKSVHVDGSVTSSGVPVGLNLGINRAGDMSGTITEHGANLNVLSTDGKVFFKATPAFLKQAGAPSATCSLVCGKWVQLPPKQASQLTSQLTMANLTGETAGSSGTAQPKFSETGTGTVNGQSTWVLKGQNGAKIDVTQQNTPYPVQVKPANGQGVVKYSKWNSVPKPKAPPANEVINLSGLQSGH
jgi:hypothetical protein